MDILLKYCDRYYMSKQQTERLEFEVFDLVINVYVERLAFTECAK